MGGTEPKGLTQGFHELDAVARLSVRSAVGQVPIWLEMLSGKRVNTKLAATASRMLEQALIEVFLFQKRCKRLKTVENKKRKQQLRTDLNAMLHRVDPTIPGDQDAVHWRIDRIEEDLAADNYLHYLQNTRFREYQSEIHKLVKELHSEDKRGELLRLLSEFGTSRDIYSVGQLFSNRMVGHIRFVSKVRKRIHGSTIWRYLQIYLDSCGAYEKDISLIACMLRVKELDNQPRYGQIRKEKFYGTLKYVGRRMPLLELPFEKSIRDAKAHENAYLNPTKKTICFVRIKGQLVERTYPEFVALVEEMTSVVLALRLVPLHLSYLDWETIDAILT